jgi:hypothetical protein
VIVVVTLIELQAAGKVVVVAPIVPARLLR